MNGDLPWYIVNRPLEDFQQVWERFRLGYDDSGEKDFQTELSDENVSRDLLLDKLYGSLGGVQIAANGAATTLTPIRPPRPNDPTVRRYLSRFPTSEASIARRNIVTRQRQEHEHFWRVLLGYLHNERMPPIALHVRAWQRLLESWAGAPIFSPERIRLPWQTVVPLSLSDVRAAVHSHLEHLAGKRFPAEWDVQVQSYEEQPNLAYRYDTKSANRMVGHIRLRHLADHRTDIEIIASQHAEENDIKRFREILVVFAERWLDQLEYSTRSELLPQTEQSQKEPATAGSSQSTTTKRDYTTPEIPKRPADLNRWKRDWKLVKRRYHNMSLEELASKSEIKSGVHTLRKIIRAGEAGKLD